MSHPATRSRKVRQRTARRDARRLDITAAERPDRRVYDPEYAAAATAGRGRDDRPEPGEPDRIGCTWHDRGNAGPLRTSTGFDSIRPRL